MPAPLEGAGEADPLGLVVVVASFLDAEAEPEGEADSLADTPALTAASGLADPETEARREGPVGVAEAPPGAAPAPVARAPFPQPIREEPAVSVWGGGVVSPLGEAIWSQRKFVHVSFIRVRV